jgi:Cupin superfamily protein
MSLFWDRVKSHWASKPFVVRGGSPLIISPSIAVDAWIQAASGHDSTGNDIRFFVGSEYKSDFQEYKPNFKFESFASYFSNLSDKHGINEFGLILANAHSYSPSIYSVLIAFLFELYRNVGTPVGGSDCNIFSMTHRTSMLGVHKDAQDVITIGVEGKRRFLLWPLNYFNSRMRAHFGEFDVAIANCGLNEEDRKNALTLDIEAGDIAYWPSGWWHVGESSNCFGTTLSVGINRKESTTNLLKQCWEEVRRGSPWPAQIPRENFLNDLTRSVSELLSSDKFSDALQASICSTLTSAGLLKLPPRTYDYAPFLATSIFMTISSDAIEIAQSSRNDHAAIFFAGRRFNVPNYAEALGVIQYLKSLEEFTYSEFERTCSAAGTKANLILRYAIEAGAIVRLSQ